MELKSIDFTHFNLRPVQQWDNQWFLLTAGNFARKHFNSMTVAWGSIGVMWSKPFVQVVVRPTRYTYQFMNEYDTFTLCAFPKAYRQALTLLGSRSGRDGDKIGASGLTPIPATQVTAPAYAEAELILECRKIYWDDFEPVRFLDASIENNYSQSDYHRIYFGEILTIAGTSQYHS